MKGEGLIRRILLVDNHAGFRGSVRKALELEGFDVLEVDSGTDALLALTSETIHLILTDLNMPHMSGVELIYAIRASAAGKNIPIFVLSVAYTELRVKEVLDAGANGYFQKPLNITEFLERTHSFLKSEPQP